MQRRLEEPPPDVRTMRPDVPDELAAVVRRALMVDPAERYLTAGQMVEALTTALELLPVT
jgi:serine/threonine-protein kinase